MIPRIVVQLFTNLLFPQIVGTTAAILGATLAGVGGSIAGAVGASKAANAQEQAANNAANVQRQNAVDALNFQKGVYNDQQRLLFPYAQIGTNSLNRLAYLMGIQGSPMLYSPPSTTTTSTPGGARLIDLLRGNVGGGDGLMRAGTEGVGPIPMSAQGSTVSMNGGSSVPMLSNPTPMNGGGSVPITGGPSGIFPMGNPGTVSADGSPLQVPIVNDANGNPLPSDFGSLTKDFTFSNQDPSFQFRLKQGMDALQKSAAARGNLLTGGTLKAINDYAQGSASQEYQNAYNRYTNDQTNKFNRFAALAGLGQTSTGQLVNAGSSTAGSIGNILLNSGGQIGNALENAGAARGSGYVGGANAISGGLSGLANNITLLSLLKGQQPGASGWGVI